MPPPWTGERDSRRPGRLDAGGGQIGIGAKDRDRAGRFSTLAMTSCLTASKLMAPSRIASCAAATTMVSAKTSVSFSDMRWFMEFLPPSHSVGRPFSSSAYQVICLRPSRPNRLMRAPPRIGSILASRFAHTGASAGEYCAPFQIRSATGQHRRHGGVSGGGKGRGQGL